MKEVNLVDDEQTNQLRVGPVAGLAGDDIPLLRGGDDDLRVVNLGPAQGDVTGELPDVDPVRLEAVAEVTHHLRHERLHGRHVDNLERGCVDATVGPAVQANLVEDGEHRHVGLTRTRGRTQEHILRREHRGVVHLALHPVQGLHATERGLRPLWKLFDGAEDLAIRESLRLQRGDVNLLVALLGAAVRSRGQLAPLVGHQVGSRGKGQGIQFEHLTPGSHGPGAGVGHVSRDLAA